MTTVMVSPPALVRVQSTVTFTSWPMPMSAAVVTCVAVTAALAAGAMNPTAANRPASFIARTANPFACAREDIARAA